MGLLPTDVRLRRRRCPRARRLSARARFPAERLPLSPSFAADLGQALEALPARVLGETRMPPRAWRPPGRCRRPDEDRGPPPQAETRQPRVVPRSAVSIPLAQASANARAGFGQVGLREPIRRRPPWQSGPQTPRREHHRRSEAGRLPDLSRLQRGSVLVALATQCRAPAPGDTTSGDRHRIIKTLGPGCHIIPWRKASHQRRKAELRTCGGALLYILRAELRIRKAVRQLCVTPL